MPKIKLFLTNIMLFRRGEFENSSFHRVINQDSPSFPKNKNKALAVQFSCSKIESNNQKKIKFGNLKVIYNENILYISPN